MLDTVTSEALAPMLSFHKYKTMNDNKLAQKPSELHQYLFFFVLALILFFHFIFHAIYEIPAIFITHTLNSFARHSVHTRVVSFLFCFGPIHMLIHLSQVGNNGVNCIGSIFSHILAMHPSLCVVHIHFFFSSLTLHQASTFCLMRYNVCVSRKRASSPFQAPLLK